MKQTVYGAQCELKYSDYLDIQKYIFNLASC